MSWTWGADPDPSGPPPLHPNWRNPFSRHRRADDPPPDDDTNDNPDDEQETSR